MAFSSSLAIINQYLHLVDDDTLDDAIKEHFPKEWMEKNLQALEAGRELYQKKYT